MKDKKKTEEVFAEEKELDAVLAQLVKMKPTPMKKLKAPGRKGSKNLFRRKPSAS
jgi:hypothetical protein